MITFYERSLVFGIKLVQTNNAVNIRPHNQKITLFSDWFKFCTTIQQYLTLILSSFNSISLNSGEFIRTYDDWP